jgi:Domain of unknown function (DUF4153)
MILKLSNFTNLAPIIKESFRRFPLPFICALISTLLTIIVIYDPELGKVDSVTKSIFTLSFSVVALTSFKLYAESATWSYTGQAIGAVVVISVLALYLFGIVVEESASTYSFLALAVLLSLLFTPYINKSSNAASVWYFNFKSGNAIFFAGLSAMVLGIGLSLIVASLNYLFDIVIQEKVYVVIWTVSWGLLFPVYVLSNISKEFDFEDEGCEFPKGISFIANYILVPLMFVYMAILYTYFIKIVINWELPRGNLGWMITTFGTIGIVTKLLAYPIHNKGTRLLAFFDKYYYYALIVPIILLAIAIIERVNEYGFTEQRYAVFMIGIWLSAVTVLSVINKERFHIKYVPIILAILALLSSIGPWSAVAVSTYSQVSRLEALLVKNHMFVNGQAVASEKEVSFEDKKSISSIADYLTENKYRFAHIKPWFTQLVANSNTIVFDEGKLKNGMEIADLLKISYINKWQKIENDSFFNYTTKYQLNKVFIDVSNYDFVSQETLYSYNNSENLNITELHHEKKAQKITCRLNDGVFIVETLEGGRIEFDINDRIKNIKAKNISTGMISDEDLITFFRKSDNGKLDIGLIMTGIQGEMKAGSKTKINVINYILMLKLNNE